ncbi:MAG TPA: hypothetical protein VFV98_06075 [Vicinamibacterales bacterium]|nr:hypothetical protein [Vicinamibacterales bacterium]
MQHPTRAAMRRTLVRRSLRNGAIVFSLIGLALGIGAVGYHLFEDLPWLDAALNAAMILTGMGPVNPITTPAGKLFAIVYSLLSGVFFLTMVAVLLSPAAKHLIHSLHLDLDEQQRKRDQPPRK